MRNKVYNIRWKKSDYIKLGLAVSKFNKQIKNLYNKQNRYVLPNLYNYQDLKKNIYTRQNLNEIIRDLNNFSRGKDNDIIEVSGRKITKWENRILQKQQRRAIKAIEKEIKPYKEEVKNSGGFSRAQMGNREYINLEAKLKEIKNFNKIEDIEKYKRVKKSIEALGNYDYRLKKATIYKENYLEVLKNYYSNFRNYDILLEKIKILKNPFLFYDVLKDNEIIGDLTLQSDQKMAQYEFDNFVKEFGEEYFNEEFEKLKEKTKYNKKEESIKNIYDKMNKRYII